MFRSFFLAAGLLSSLSLSLTSAEAQSLPEEIVNALNKVWGVHPGFRANHAKGIVGQGTFKATPEAATLSKAAIFTGDTIPVTIRFSDSGGLPNVPDGSPQAVPHGLAIKFHLKDGSETDIVINSLKFFPVATGEGIPRSSARHCREPTRCAEADQARSLFQGVSARPGGLRRASAAGQLGRRAI